MSIIVPLDTHPAFQRRRLVRQARRLSADCHEAGRKLDEMRDALIAFDEQLQEHKEGLAPTRRETRATLAALDSGDIDAMETLRGEILRRLGRSR